MKAVDVMSTPVVSVHPETPLCYATVVAVENRFSTLPVVDTDQRLLGVLTEKDLLRHGLRTAAGRGADGGTVRVRDVMSTPVSAMPPTATLGELADAMAATPIRCLPIVDDGRLVGVVSRGDVLRTYIRADDVTASKVRQMLAEYSGDGLRWTVEVVGGAAAVSGEFSDEAEQGMVVALVRTVPGVIHVELRPCYGRRLADAV